MLLILILITCYCKSASILNFVYEFSNVDAKYSKGVNNVNISTLCALEYLGIVWQTNANDVWLSIGGYSVVKYRHPKLMELPAWD